MYSWLQQEVLTKNSGWKQIKNFSKNDDMLYLRWADSLIFSADGKNELPNGCALSSSNGSIVLAPIQKRTRTKLFLHCKYLNTSVNNHILSRTSHAYQSPHTPKLSSDRIPTNLCIDSSFSKTHYSSEAWKTNTRQCTCRKSRNVQTPSRTQSRNS